MADESNCSNGYEDLVVELVHVSHERPFEMFWNWFKRTWYSLHDEEFDCDNPEHIRAAEDVASRRALPTPMEVLSFEVKIRGLSRVALAQITRGRVGNCFNVTSQMPQRMEHAVTVPRNIYENPMFASRVQQLQETAQQLYDDMYEAGIPPQDCRYVTLHGQQTSLMWHVNYAALLGWYARRCENGLTDELNTVGRQLRRALIDRYISKPPHFSYDDPSTWGASPGSGWEFLIRKLDCMGAERGVCLNNDRVFGNTGRFPSAGDWVPSPVNEELKPDYRFDRSAFFLELLNMDESMLFPGEKEMVDDWLEVGFDGRLRKLQDSKC